MEHHLKYSFQSEETSIPWTFRISFDDHWVMIEGIEPERNKVIYEASIPYISNKVDWDRLPVTFGLRNDKLYPNELRIYVEKLLAMKAFW